MAKIPIILEPGRADGKLTTSNSIFDENKGMFQSEINDIQDTLNSDNPNKPLSAKQGKVLKGLIDAKVIEVGAVPIDTEPIEGNTTHVVTSDGLAKEFNKCNTAIITTNRIEDNAVTSEKISTSAFDSTLSLSGKIAPADVVGEKITELELNETIIPADEITSIYPNDLDFSDANNNIIVEFKDGHVKTKNFDSSKDATLLERGLMSASDKEKLENINTKLTTIEEGAEVNDTEVINARGNDDLNISDEEGNMIVEFKDGHVKTKNFDSKSAEQKLTELEPFSHKDTKEADFDVVDENNNIIFSVIQGWFKTKNFSGKHVYDVLNSIGIQEWSEQWSRMPKTEDDNPLAKIRFDGGMCRIFRKWGFIGDSLCSGTINGYVVSLLEYTPIVNKAILNGIIVDDSTSIVSDNVTLVGRYPCIKLIFENNSGLSEKVLLASYSNGTYTPLITGSNTKEYSSISIPNNSVIAISYPNNNTPRVLLSVDGTQLANYEMSWGQQLVRLLGAEGYNFSVGGEYAKRWCQGSGGTGSRNWDRAQQTEYLKDAYIIGLGVNDASYWMSGQTTIVDYPCVTAYPNQSDYVDGLVLTENDIMNDIDMLDYNNNANSFAGWYAGVVQRIKSVRKDAYIFCCTLPAARFNSPYSQVIRKIVEKFNAHYKEGTIWLLDLAKFNPITTEMAQYIKNDSHLTAFGYLYSAYQFTSYIDWIIRHNIQKFKDVPFIGTNIVSEIFDEYKIN